MIGRREAILRSVIVHTPQSGDSLSIDLVSAGARLGSYKIRDFASFLKHNRE